MAHQLIKTGHCLDWEAEKKKKMKNMLIVNFRLKNEENKSKVHIYFIIIFEFRSSLSSGRCLLYITNNRNEIWIICWI